MDGQKIKITEFFMLGDTMKCNLCRARIGKNETFRFCPMCGRKVVRFIGYKGKNSEETEA